MSQEELDKKIVELKELLSKVMKLLEKDQRQGCVLKKTIKWPKLQQRLQQRRIKWLVEELRTIELDMEVSICKLERGEILGDDERSAEDLMNYWDSSRQHENMLTEEAGEATKAYIFKSDKLCVSTRLIEDYE